MSSSVLWAIDVGAPRVTTYLHINTTKSLMQTLSWCRNTLFITLYIGKTGTGDYVELMVHLHQILSRFSDQEGTFTAQVLLIVLAEL